MTLSKTFDRGGCSHATGTRRRCVLPIFARARAVQVTGDVCGFIRSSLTFACGNPPTGIGGGNIAACAPAAEARLARTTAAKTRTPEFYAKVEASTESVTMPTPTAAIAAAGTYAGLALS